MGGRAVAIRTAGWLALGVVLVAAAGAGDEAPMRAKSGAGMRAYVDPQTGELTPERPKDLPPEPAPVLDRSSTGLVETPTPGGGSMLNLRGRFQSPLTATVEPDGRLRLRHAGD